MAHVFQGFLRLNLMDQGVVLVENTSTGYVTTVPYASLFRVLRIHDDELTSKISELLHKRYSVMYDSEAGRVYRPKPRPVPDAVVDALASAEPTPDPVGGAYQAIGDLGPWM